MFWDSSAIIPLCVVESHAEYMKELLRSDPLMTVWWETLVECHSAFARLHREGALEDEGEGAARGFLQVLERGWSEIRPGGKVRQQAIRGISIHELKAADSLQLAAAIIWTGNDPGGYSFVCLDKSLRTAAQKEGFVVLPEAL